MKNLRYLLIGAVLGGAFGAKLGSYLAVVWNEAVPTSLIEAGFVYGSFSGMLSAIVFLVAYSLATASPKDESLYSHTLTTGA